MHTKIIPIDADVGPLLREGCIGLGWVGQNPLFNAARMGTTHFAWKVNMPMTVVGIVIKNHIPPKNSALLEMKFFK